MSNNTSLDTYHLNIMQSNFDLQRCIDVILIPAKKNLIFRLQFAARVVLVTLLSFGLARLFWLALPIPEIPPAVIVNSQEKTLYSKDDNLNITSGQIEKLKSLSIFGKPKPELKAVNPIVDASSVVTHLNIVLMGIVASNHEKYARAILSLANQQDIYAVGDSLPLGDDITLAKIFTDSVIINNKGQYESLYLYQEDAKSKASINHTAAAAPLSPTMIEWLETHKEPEVEALPEKPTIYSADQAITEVSRSMSHVVAMNVFLDGGKMTGYKIQPGRDIEKFKSLGLKAGDLVIAINGWPMSNPEQIMEMYQEMSPAGSASLQIKRGANVVTVDIPPL